MVCSTGAHGLSGLRATVLVSPVDNQYSSSLPFRKLDRRFFGWSASQLLARVFRLFGRGLYHILILEVQR